MPKRKPPSILIPGAEPGISFVNILERRLDLLRQRVIKEMAEKVDRSIMGSGEGKVVPSPSITDIHTEFFREKILKELAEEGKTDESDTPD